MFGDDEATGAARAVSPARIDVVYGWRGAVESAEIDQLHAEGFGHEPNGFPWSTVLNRHSLGWVCARADSRLAGFVNVAWDGASHAFYLDVCDFIPTAAGLIRLRRD